VAQKLIDMVGSKVKGVLAQEDQLLETCGFQHIEDNLYKCLLALDSAGKSVDASSDLKRLPAIIFHLTVRGCNRLLARLVNDLEAHQNASEARQFCKIILGASPCLQGVLMKNGTVSDIVARIMATAVNADDVEDAELKRAVEQSQVVQEFTVADAERFMAIDRIQANLWTSIDELDETLAEEARDMLAKVVAAKKRYYIAIAAKCDTENKARLKTYEQALKDDTPEGEEKETYVEPPTFIVFDELLEGYIDKRFSFLPEGQTITNDDMKAQLGRWYDATDINAKALQRGIGLHYSELPRKNKNAVERMFRARKLKVVIATSTLAMGINMPCKTVIMAGDEPDLSSREYHQMIGRAGRRTFDNRGNVVFIGTPSRKVNRLLSTNVADLVGNVPLTPGLALRLFMRHHGVTVGGKESSKVKAINEKHTLAMSERLVRYPFFNMGANGENDTEQVMHQLLFCTEFLMDPSVGAFVKGEDGKAVPSPLCSLMLHMSFLEPANHVLLSLLQSGLLDKLVQDVKVDPLKVLASNVSKEIQDELGLSPKGLEDEVKAQREALLQVFANIFFLIPLPKRSRTLPDDAKSSVKLAPPNPEVAEHMSTYNKIVLEKFSSFVRRYAENEGTQGETDQLPGSKAEKAQPTRSAAVAPEGSLVGDLKGMSINTAARSPFVAISGHSDNFSTVDDLCGSLQDGVYLDRSLVPVVTESANTPCNAYLSDYFRHAERAPLSQENGLRDASLYDKLNKFCHAMKVVKIALTKRCSEDEAGEFTRVDDARGGMTRPAAALGSRDKRPGPKAAVKARVAKDSAESHIKRNRCIEVRISEKQDEWEEKSGTLARIQIKIIKSEPYRVLLQCPNRVPTPGTRCAHCTRLALVEAITSLEQEYLKKFKDVFAFKSKW